MNRNYSGGMADNDSSTEFSITDEEEEEEEENLNEDQPLMTPVKNWDVFEVCIWHISMK